MSNPKLQQAIEVLHQAIGKLEERRPAIEQKAERELQIAKHALNQEKNTDKARFHLRRKKTYLKQIERIDQYQDQLHNMIITFEGFETTRQVYEAQESAARAIRQLNPANGMNTLSEIDEVMTQLNEVTAATTTSGEDLDDELTEDDLALLGGEDDTMFNAALDDLSVPTRKLPSRSQAEVKEEEAALKRLEAMLAV